MADCSAQNEEKESPHEIERDASCGGREECFKGGTVDSDMSGKEIARALVRLSRRGGHEFVAKMSADVVESLLGYAPNLTLIQQMPERFSSSAVGSVVIESCR